MALAHPFETLAFDMQEMLQERVVVTSATPAQTRNRLTRRLAETFEQIVTAIEPDLILEVGAHDASFSRKMAQALPHAEVHAFEAHPGNVARFGPAAQEAGVAYRHLALLDAPGTLHLQVPLTGDGGERIGMGSLRTLPGRAVATYDVEASSLDALFPGDARASAMWIDVEGAQHEVLSGGTALLERCKALYMEVESAEKWRGQRLFDDIAGLLRGVGLRPALRDVQRRGWQFNVIFVAEELMASERMREIWQGHFKRVLRSTIR